MGGLQSFLGYSGSFWSSYNGLVRGMKTGVGVSFSSFWKSVITTPHCRGSPPLLPVEVVPVLKTAVNTQRLGHKWHGGWCTTSPFSVWARGCGAGAAKEGQTRIWGLSVDQSRQSDLALRTADEEKSSQGRASWLGKQPLSLRTAWRGGERVPAATQGFRGSLGTAAASWSLGGPRTGAVASTPGRQWPDPKAVGLLHTTFRSSLWIWLDQPECFQNSSVPPNRGMSTQTKHQINKLQDVSWTLFTALTSTGRSGEHEMLCFCGVWA